MIVNKLPRVKKILTEERNCENCGGMDLETLWNYEHEAKTRNHVFKFDVNNVICKGCGFVFVSPVYSRESLTDYYADAFSLFSGQKPDYDIEKRLELILQVANGQDLLVEVGSNMESEFHQKLRERFKRVLTVEINESVESDCRTVVDLPAESADLVVIYFVLEHVPHVKSFLDDCGRLLQSQGAMIIEVPNMLLYPVDPVALALYEHTSHFSLPVLDQLAGQCGLFPIGAFPDLCSRPFGFAAAYRKEPGRKPSFKSASFYEQNKKYFLDGLKNLCRLRELIVAQRALLKRYESEGKEVVLWAANEMMKLFLFGSGVPNGVKVVDSNPSKASYLDDFPVLMPDAAEMSIRMSAGIFIFTKLHAQVILDDIRDHYGKIYQEKDIHIVDYDLNKVV